MKIAHLVTEFPKISDTFIYNQIFGQLDRDLDLTIFSKFRRSAETVHQRIRDYNLTDRHAPFQIPRNKLERIIELLPLCLKHPCYLTQFLRNYLLSSEDVSPSTPINTFFALRESEKLSKCDVMHCHFGWNGNFGSWLKRQDIYSGKIVTSFYGSDVTVYSQKSDRDVYDLVFDESDLILVVNEEYYSILLDLGCPEEKLTLHRTGIDPNKYTFRPSSKKDDNYKILSVARLTECKGLSYGIKAFRKLKDEVDSMEYTIIGGGSLRSDLEDLIERLSLEDSVDLVGTKDHDKVIKWMYDSDLLLAPSVTMENGRQDSTMMVLIEAMVVGLPVLGFDYPAIHEIVTDGESGLLVPERDVDALAAEMKQFLLEEDWESLARNARDVIETKFNMNEINTQLIEYYQQLIDDNHSKKGK